MPPPRCTRWIGDVVGVALDQRADLVDVGGRAGRGVHVHDEAVLAGGRRRSRPAAGGRPRRSARPPSRKLSLSARDAVLAGQGERLVGAARRPAAAARPTARRGRGRRAAAASTTSSLQRERDVRVRHAVVRQDQRPLGALGVEVGEQLVDGRPGGDVGLHRRPAVERVRRQHAEVPVRVVHPRRAPPRHEEEHRAPACPPGDVRNEFVFPEQRRFAAQLQPVASQLPALIGFGALGWCRRRPADHLAPLQ